MKSASGLIQSSKAVQRNAVVVILMLVIALPFNRDSNAQSTLLQGLYEGLIVDEEDTIPIYVFFDPENESGFATIWKKKIDSLPFSSMFVNEDSVVLNLGSHPIQLRFQGRFSEESNMIEGVMSAPPGSCSAGTPQARFRLVRGGTEEAKQLVQTALPSSDLAGSSAFDDAFECLREEKIEYIYTDYGMRMMIIGSPLIQDHSD